MVETPDLETALWKMLSEYTDLKTKMLKQQIEAFESKWNGTFEEFSERCQRGTLEADPYTYEVESDFWAWEKAETLLQHYKALQIKT
jgi:hypothetical protein